MPAGRQFLEEMRTRFGSEVAEIIAGCSDTFETPKPPWRRRKEAYIVHLNGASAPVLLVSAADKLHNIRWIVSVSRNIGEALWERFTGGAGRHPLVLPEPRRLVPEAEPGPACLRAGLGCQ